MLFASVVTWVADDDDDNDTLSVYSRVYAFKGVLELCKCVCYIWNNTAKQKLILAQTHCKLPYVGNVHTCITCLYKQSS